MNLKIECACGQKIAFDVEPENGVMPCELPCPSCQTDITGLANAEIRRQSAPPPPTAPTMARLRVSAPAGAPAPETAAVAAPPEAAPVSAAEPPRSSRPMATALAAAAAAAPVTGDDGEASGKAFLLGTVGVLLGALAGVLVWFLLAQVGLTHRIAAILVAVGAGAGGRFFCRGGDKSLGGVAAVLAVIGMFFGGAITFNKAITDKFVMNDKELRESYADDIRTSKEILTQIPNGTDEEVARYLTKADGPDAEATTAKDVADFRASDEFKNAKAMADGKITFETYSKNYHKEFYGATKDAQKVVGAVGAARMLSIWLILLVGSTAYKIAAG
ncbi:MAG TPA: hypothetical protein VMB21_17525 [Candidatus Limnocylindria bacterium]|nr:hypothetical protein [Candidatus Limnocylindria bacterium]